MPVRVCARGLSRFTLLTTVLTVSCSNVLSFISHALSAKSSVTKRHAATAIPGGVTTGNVERGKEPKQSAPSTSAETDPPSPKQSPSPPSVDPSEGISLKEAKSASSAVGPRQDASRIETKTVEDAKPTAASVGLGAKSSVKVSNVPQAVMGADSSIRIAAAGEASESVVGAEGRAATSVEKKKKKDGVGPETTAAEKVLTLLEIGLVDKEEIAAYYEALSELELTTQEAKVAAAAAAAAPLNPSKSSSSTPFSTEDGPLSLVPFPVVCAALGAAGTHALHLTGDVATATSVLGAVAGATLGSLVVAGDDAGGRAARAAGSVVARSASTAGGAMGGAVGKGLSESIGGVAGAAASAVEEAFVKAPANLVAGLATSTSSAVSSAVESVVSLPGRLAAKAADGAKGALQDTSEAVARKASQVAAGALQSTSDAALEVVKETPKEAAKRLKEVVAGPGESLAALVTRASDKGAGTREERAKVPVQLKPVPSASARQESTMVAPSEQETLGPEGIPAEELEAKMSSVRKALERFDDVKNRIEEAQTSDTFKKTVGMTRSMDMSAEREKGEQARAAAQKAKDLRVESKEAPEPRLSPPEMGKSARLSTERKATANAQDRRKQVAERLLEKASQRAAEAQTDLKAAATSARREADLAAAASTSDEQKTLQEAAASR